MKILLVPLVLAISGSAAFAQDQKPRNSSDRATIFFERLDTDSSGELSLEELRAVRSLLENDRSMERTQKAPPPSPRERLFERLDANGDGMLSREEFLPQAQRAGRSGDFERSDRPGFRPGMRNDFRAQDLNNERMRERGDKSGRPEWFEQRNWDDKKMGGKKMKDEGFAPRFEHKKEGPKKMRKEEEKRGDFEYRKQDKPKKD